MIPVLYPTDTLIWLFFGISIIFCWKKWSSPLLQEIRNTIIKQPRYLIATCIVFSFCFIGLLDSIHLKIYHNSMPVTCSVFDVLLSPRNYDREKTYSAPFALHSFVSDFKRSESGLMQECFPELKYAGMRLQNKEDTREKTRDILSRIGMGILCSALAFFCFYFIFRSYIRSHMQPVAAKTFWATLFCIFCLISISAWLMFQYHILGTDKVGRDVFYMALKSVRTGLVIGTATSLVMLPFAISMGMWAGYFRGFIDDIIQYLYTMLGSIPGVLLIAAAVLSFQAKIEEDPDLKLLLLCLVLGATGWIGLCRLLRGETLKLREENYVLAARTLGVTNTQILLKHILPNLMHIVIISVVLDFSGLVLAESVLSYVGVGVSPTTYSWGNMINAARLEMAREPMIWWSLFAAFIFMFLLVFSTNILGDALQKALNPKEQ